MGAEVAEQLESVEYYPEVHMPTGQVEVVPDMVEDEMVRLRAARFIGACLLDGQVEVSSTPEPNLAVQPIESLFDAIHLAAEGDIMARKMVETNVRTDVVERTIKTGHIIKVDLGVDEAGIIQQYGQSMESVQANSLKLAADSWQMQERTRAEATNAFRIEQLHRQDILKDYSFVVFSRAADNMTNQEMSEVGFFTETMSCAIQVTTADGSSLTTESAFVAGVKSPGETRHDEETVVMVAESLGADYSGKSAAEIIATPLLVHNSLMPNGVVDLVEMYDKSAGETFFGESKPKNDYLEYKDQCLERERTLQPKVECIVDELVAKGQTIRNRLDAAKKLHEISEKHMVEQAVFDNSINPRVFGSTAASHIEQARIYIELGDNKNALLYVSKAKSTAVSSSCPSALKSGINADARPEDQDTTSSSSSGEDKYGSLTFKCQKGHNNTRPRNRLIDKCKTCGVSVRC